MLETLDWLPPPPKDFADRLRALEEEIASTDLGGDFFERLTALATTAADEPQITSLARLAARLASSGIRLEGLAPARLGLVGDGTLSLALGPVAGSGLRHGLLLDVVEGDYGSALREARDCDSPLHHAGLDFLLICPHARLLGLDRAALSHEEAASRVEEAFQQIKAIADGFRPSVRRSILVQTTPPLAEPLFGSFDRAFSGSPFAMIEALNGRLADWAGDGSAILVDTARLATTVGLERWHAADHWHAAKLPFSPDLLPLYGDHVARTIAAALGRGRKCLVLDLDNTCWGGVIGDDGLGGIILGQGSGDGEAYIAIQRMALELRARGIVLAVCSKNDDDQARLPFREHPDMLLREEDIAVFHANWTDKAANLKAIAEALNIGVDALVLLDDNPAERLQVRQVLPLAAVPELPDDPALFPATLAAAGYFDAVTFSQEDRDRAGFYQANASRAQVLSASEGLDDYLASLDMTCRIALVDPTSRKRVAQLINKSNQFNLTTRRYTEPEVEAMETDPSRHAIAVRLADRFGDNGLISVIIADRHGETWDIDTWLMSCRVLGRGVEQAVLNHLAAAASAEGAFGLIGHYRPTAKNRMVAGHYAGLGFHQIGGDDGETVWRLDLAGLQPEDLMMEVEDSALKSREGDSR
jgi:FkbH-like protein